MNTEIGKIEKCWIGHGGYQDAQFGACFILSTTGGSVADFYGCWQSRSEGASWTEEDWNTTKARTMTKIMETMREAKVKDFADLKNKPIEATFEGGRLMSWRILTEVL